MSNLLNGDWKDEIIRETEHYYQGELQQEERASWLLASSSGLLAIIISVYLSLFDKVNFISTVSVFIAVVFFFISAIFALLGLIPYSGCSIYKQDFFGHRFRRELNLFPKELMMKKFQPDSEWSDESLEKRLIFHFRNHYLRNLLKSRMIIWSAIFFMIGLLIVLCELFYFLCKL